MKRRGGKDIRLIGGGELAGALYSEIDRLVVKVGPLTIGTEFRCSAAARGSIRARGG
ncbi:hypothetical protein [Yinghuangia sp. YIM S10712]|uniref:hypothetical protein n=1 Tax=Yinghuangia sp. YIM S10712 TaxID=3436930 RepID=UPI003F539674